jgi:hypothetical protein
MAAFAGFERAAPFLEPPLELRAGHDSIIQQIGCADRIMEKERLDRPCFRLLSPSLLSPRHGIG